MTLLRRLPRIATLVGARFKGSKNENLPLPAPSEINEKNAEFDKVTHTGQVSLSLIIPVASFFVVAVLIDLILGMGSGRVSSSTFQVL
jgi:hypothetical protein